MKKLSKSLIGILSLITALFIFDGCKEKEWTGTCFAIGGNYLATNYHVVKDAKNILVTSVKDNSNYTVDVVAVDEINDLAILKITEPDFKGFGTLKYGFKTQTTDIGTDVFTLGYTLNPSMGEDINLATGVISSKSGFQGNVSQYKISSSVQPGNSGGPLFDSKGNVIGIISTKHTETTSIGYAIKLSYLQNLAESANENIKFSGTNKISALSLPEKIKIISPNILIVKANFSDANKQGNQNSSETPIDSTSSLPSKESEEQLPPKTITVNGYSFDMIHVEGGTFTMGATFEQGDDADDDEKPAHRVTLDSYYIGKYEVTQGLWKTVMGDNPSKFQKGDNYPVGSVSWDDCQEFIHKLNKKTNKKFRLPTEAEWEFAARGGNKSRGYKYSGSNTLTDVAWYNDNSYGTARPVGKRRPNELGIYDMSGNVMEWCFDWLGDYCSYLQTNPTGPDIGVYRVLRGGDYDDGVSWGHCRVSCRRYDYQYYVVYSYGLRLVLEE